MAQISFARDLDILGHSFRKAFFAKVTPDFDDILGAIDRAHLAFAAKLNALPRSTRVAPPDWLIAPVFRSTDAHH